MLNLKCSNEGKYWHNYFVGWGTCHILPIKWFKLVLKFTPIRFQQTQEKRRQVRNRMFFLKMCCLGNVVPRISIVGSHLSCFITSTTIADKWHGVWHSSEHNLTLLYACRGLTEVKKKKKKAKVPLCHLKSQVLIAVWHDLRDCDTFLRCTWVQRYRLTFS